MRGAWSEESQNIGGILEELLQGGDCLGLPLREVPVEGRYHQKNIA